MARMILLGVGLALPDAERENTHMVWDGPGGPLLIDAGGSTYQRLLRAGIDPTSLRGILLTHSHADHINSLPVLLFSLSLAGRRAPLPIYGLPPTLELAQRIVAAFHLEEHVAPVTWEPIHLSPTDSNIPLLHLDSDWVLMAAHTRHSRPCVGVRFEQRSTARALVYSGDTAPCEPITRLAHGATVLIHEATLKEPSDSHTTPQEAGALAAQVGAAWLVLVHFSPRWTMPEDAALAAVRAGGFTGRADIGQEYQVLDM